MPAGGHFRPVIFPGPARLLGKLSKIFPVELYRIVDFTEGHKLTAVKHEAAVTIGLNRPDVMRDHDHAAAAAFFVECLSAPQAESRVADGGDFVDEVAIEIDRHGEAEGETGHHAGRIGADRHFEITSEFGKIFDEINHAAQVGAVDPANEFDILAPCHQGMQSAAEAKRPGDPDIAEDLAGIGQLAAADQAEKRRFSRPVRAEDAIGVPLIEQIRDIVENDLAMVLSTVNFRHAGKPDHCAPSRRELAEGRPPKSHDNRIKQGGLGYSKQAEKDSFWIG
jgi:hypothetical protein